MDPSEVTVLVVEDDEFTRMATIDILKSCRYTVFAVENGQQALDVLVTNHAKFDLVLCDVMLPVMTGIELLDEIQKHSATLGHIPIVMTSSNEEMDVVTSCLSKGAKDYLIKPIQVNTAKTLVRHVWLSRRLERTSNKSMWQDIEVIRTIGKGTHGTVVLARRKLDGAVVAVKRVRISQISENGRKQADNEVILLKSLYHVNIVRFYDHFLADDELNIVMEYSDGGNLRQLVKLRAREKMGPFPEPVIMSWFAQLVLAVAYIHGKNVLHRDLKAQNVFLTHKNVVKLGDFGISKALAGDATANTACGTPESMSPEICRGEPYGKKSDIWSLGCILYEMIMLRRPFEASTLPEIFTKICKGEFPPILPSFSRDLRLLVQLMLQQDASKRPSIEDICRFPFVQNPIQAFLSEHVSEFQEALELEAKLHQPSLYSAGAGNPPAPSASPTQRRRNHNSSSETPTSGFGDLAPDSGSPVSSRSDASSNAGVNNGDLRSSAIAAVAIGLGPDSIPGSIARPQQNADLSKISVDSPGYVEDNFADKLRAQVTIGDVRVGLFTTYTACIAADELVRVLKSKFNKSDEQAAKILADFLKTRVLNVVFAEDTTLPDLTANSTYLRFQVDELFVPLNMKYVCVDEVQQGPMEVCLRAREAIAELHALKSFPRGIGTGFSLPNHVSVTGSSAMEYFDAPLCQKYRRFLKLTSKLQKVDVGSLPKHERQPFFINIYNAMVLHGLVEFGVPQNIGQYKAFERDVAYTIGGLDFTLGDVKHGILRCNRKPPSNYWERQLQAQDPKLQFRLHIRDPRSLLVLIDCAEPLPTAEDVPILKPGRTDTDLEEQAEKFCERLVEVDERAGEIVLPRVLRIFRDDFGSSEAEMVSWLVQYMDNAPANIVNYRVRYQTGISS
ncbi:NEK protein kinase [Phytophthora cinnamomi]|uniref:NEK protein kinase n=1 Tax=Phytophthora cinnamomi TaxID=4785 RepID=UPI00355A3406|nr:NEK protein kinase [Phytophthora cinnamomi]